MGMLIIVLSIVFAVILYSYYVKVIKASNAVKEALSGIDVQLVKRHEVLPNILTLAKKFMTHEKEVLTEITRLRTISEKAVSGSAEKFEAETALGDKMADLLVSVENYPQLKSNETMIQAMQSYTDIEENIAAARRFYNTSLRQLNDAIMIFPGSLFRGYAADVSHLAYFEASTEQKKSVKATDYFK